MRVVPDTVTPHVTPQAKLVTPQETVAKKPRTRRKKGKNADGMGSIYPDRGGYRVQVSTGQINEKGRPILKRYRVGTHAEAVDLLKKLQTPGAVTKPSGRLTLETFFTEWMDTVQAAKNTERTVRFDSDTLKRHVYPVLGKKRLDAVTQTDVQTLLNGVAVKVKPSVKKAKSTDGDSSPKVAEAPQTYSRRTVLAVKAVLRAGFNHAVDRKLITDNPATRTVIPKNARRTSARPVLAAAAAIALLDEARKQPVYGPVVVFMLATGVRVSEAAAVRWRDIDLEGGEVHIGGVLERPKGGGYVYRSGTKTGAGRTLPLPDFAVESLKGLQEAMKRGEHPMHPEGYAFLNHAGQPWDQWGVTRGLETMCAAMEIPKVSPHVLRHTFATLVMTRVKDAQAVSKMLGHSRTDLTLDLYGHVLEDRTRHAAHALDGLFGLEKRK